MIELELFCKIVEAKIRKDHGNYLQELKCVPAEQKDKRGIFGIFRRKKIPVEDKLLKGYNAGIKKALHVLQSEFNKFNKRIEKEEKF